MDKYPENPFAKTGRYIKIKEGSIKLRLFNFIDGWEYWTEDEEGKKTPHREKELTGVPNDKKAEAKYFRAYVAYDYESGSTKILSLTQKSLIQPLLTLQNDPDWGDLSEFDITFIRKGQTREDTEYQVIQKPKKKFEGTLEDVNLEALYVNGDPFSGEVDFDKVMKDMDGE